MALVRERERFVKNLRPGACGYSLYTYHYNTKRNITRITTSLQDTVKAENSWNIKQTNKETNKQAEQPKQQFSPEESNIRRNVHNSLGGRGYPQVRPLAATFLYDAL